ncbi:MAG: zinc-binding dehydrogenase [Aridibacter sp.]
MFQVQTSVCRNRKRSNTITKAANLGLNLNFHFAGENFQISTLSLLGKMQTVRGYNLNLETPQNMQKFTGELMKHLSEGKLEVSVMEFPLENAAKAHSAIENWETTGKVVLKIV